MAGERSPCAGRDPLPSVRVGRMGVAVLVSRAGLGQEGLSSGGVSPHPRETGRRVGGLLQLLAVAVLVRRASGLGAVVGAAAVASVAVAVAVGLRSGLGVSVRVAVHLVPVAVATGGPVDDDHRHALLRLLQQGHVQRGDERLRRLDVVIRGHRRHVDDADGGRAHSSGEPAGPRPLRHRQQPLLGQLRVLVLLDDVDEQVADAEHGEWVEERRGDAGLLRLTGRLR
mmetsp:Transcript_31643/g.74744  ORF Transcript_31643/g.74744 Transcript_31643/m.74744 type:complete len:227 (-) Transcript_31643:234-914(-)